MKGIRRFSDPIYGAKYAVLVCKDEKQASKFLCEEITTEVAMTSFNGMTFRLWFSAPDINTIVHEAYHCVRQVNRHICADLFGESEEPMAYYMGWLVANLERATRIDENAKT